MEPKFIKIQEVASAKILKIDSSSIEIDFSNNNSKLSFNSEKYSISVNNKEYQCRRYDTDIPSSSVKNSIFDRILELTYEIFDLVEIVAASQNLADSSIVFSKVSERMTKNPNPDLKSYSFKSFVYKIEDYSQKVFFKDGKSAVFTGDKFMFSMISLLADLEQVKQEILKLI